MTSAAQPLHAPGSPAWWLEHTASSTARRPRIDGITIERITAAALGILEAEGADALTMRRLANELGTGPASLYRHVAGRDELIVLIVDRVLGEITETAVAGLDWRQVADSTARRFRSHLLAHRAVVPLISGAQMLGPSSMRGRDFAIRVFVGAGLVPADAVCAYQAIVHFTVANVQLEVRAAAHTSHERAVLARLFREQDPERHPAVVEHADVIAAQDSDAEFDFGLRAILDGIACRISPGDPTAGTSTPPT
jgi:AcrR family transcriptional regulator